MSSNQDPPRYDGVIRGKDINELGRQVAGLLDHANNALKTLEVYFSTLASERVHTQAISQALWELDVFLSDCKGLLRSEGNEEELDISMHASHIDWLRLFRRHLNCSRSLANGIRDNVFYGSEMKKYLELSKHFESALAVHRRFRQKLKIAQPPGQHRVGALNA